jgi:uncharacterized protein YbaA (DUF1428 family)
MAYVDGFIIPVPKDRLDDYQRMARTTEPVCKEYGAIGYVETVGIGLRPGETTSFIRAVQATEDEVVVLSWVIWPDKATRDAANSKIPSDPRLKEVMNNAFNPKRMIMGGFVPFLGL